MPLSERAMQWEPGPHLAFASGLFLFLPATYAFGILAVSFLSRRFPTQRSLILMIGAYALILWSPYFWGARIGYQKAPVNLDLHTKTILLSCAVGFVLILRQIRWAREYPAPFILLLFIGMAQLVFRFPSSTPLVGAIVLLKALFWGFCYHLHSPQGIKKPILPVWNFYHPGIPTLVSTDRMEYPIQTGNLNKWAARDIWLGNFLFLLGGGLFRIVFGWEMSDSPVLKLALQHLPSMGLPFFGVELTNLIGSTTLTQRWIGLFSFSLSVYLLMAAAFMTNVSIARHLGFNLPHHMNKPWVAKNFTDLYARVFFYYGQLLISFIFPIVKIVLPGQMAYRKKVVISVFFAVFLGGLMLHFIQSFNPASKHPLEAQFLRFLIASPYFLALAVFASSSFFRKDEAILKKLPLAGVTRPFFLISLSLVIHSYYVCVHFFSNPASYWIRFMASLIPTL